jgi:DNA polymerase-3 subunit alpha
MNRREDVVNYVKEKYGTDRVSNIITYGTFGAKMVVRDLARVLDVPFSESNRLAKLVPDTLNISLEKAIEQSTELATEVANNPTAAKIIEEGKVIEGMVRNVGKHACGMIIADRPLTDIVPVTLLEGSLTIQYSKGPVDKLGLLKMDFLGLRTLTIIDDAVQHIRHRPGLADFDIEKVSLEDPATFALLNSGKTIAVFQLESEGMQGLCRQFNIATIDEIIALIALYRPGPMQFIKDYIAGKKDPTAVKYVHPLLKEIASETYGILVYQEQVMQAARIVAGYTLGGADELRRAMGKKDKDAMERHRGIFVQGAARTHGIDEKTAREIFAVLEKFAEYGFNKSHSAAYAFLSYRTAYLKANYPVEFMAATLGVEAGNAEKVAFFVEECANIGVNVLGPDINQSNANFTPIPNETAAIGTATSPAATATPSPGCIRYGIGAIKGVGEIAAKAIIEERAKNGNYKDLVDFLERLAVVSAVNSRVIENLIKTGAFDCSGDDRRHLLDSVDGLKKNADAEKADRASGQTNLFDLFDMGDGTGTGAGGGADRILRKAPVMPSAEKLQYEKELLGFYLSGHPMNAYAGLERAINTLPSGPLDAAAAKYSKDIRHAIRLCGVASGIQKKITKGDPAKGTPPRPWAFFTLSTKKDSYSINLFPDAYAEFAAETHNDKLLLDENQHLLVDAELAYRADRGEWSIHAHRIAPLAERVPLLVKSVLFLLHPIGEAEDFLEKLAAALHTSTGQTTVKVGFTQPDGRVLQADLPRVLNAYCTPEFYKTFIRHPACAGAVVDIIPPAERERKWPRKR